jgi:ribonuclease HII
VKRPRLSWTHEEIHTIRLGECHIAGVDEAGRGCLAGPVVAGAIIFLCRKARPKGLNDSKLLVRADRQRLYQHLVTHTEIFWSVGIATVEEIDSINILQASHLAMRRALDGLPSRPGFVLVDGLPVRTLGHEHAALVGGDGISPSIAAASIIAKETRDRLMEVADAEFPGYGFAQHKGYGTPEHGRALEARGPCPLHRRSFAPVRQAALPLVYENG